MKKYTQAEFDALPRNEFGFKVCPTGDYSDIKDFGEVCSFGEKCSFEGGKVKNGRYIGIDRIGSELRKAYFFIDENGEMFVRTGCWFSSLADFKERVKEVHGGTKHEKHYLAACDFAELMLKDEVEQ